MATMSSDPKMDASKAIVEGSKKRKFDEIKGDWEELGDQIPMEGKSHVRARIEARCTNYMMGMAVNLDWCRACKFTQLIDILEFQGWTNLFEIGYKNELSYIIMDQFSKSFSNDNGICSVKIKNKNIEFTADDLSEAFGVPNEGFDDYFKGAYEENVDGGKVRKSFEGVCIDSMVESIGGDPSHVKTNHKNFSPIQKLLFHLVFRSIIPRTQHRDEANHLDALLIYCLENKIQINFPSLMIKHLTHCISKNMKIGYGNLLMTFLESFGIKETKEVLTMQRNHFIQSSTLLRLGLLVKDGVCVFKEQEKEEDEEEEQKVAEKEEEEADKVKTPEKTVTTVDEKNEDEEPLIKSVSRRGGRGRGRGGGALRKSGRNMRKGADKETLQTFFDLDEDEPKKDESKAEEPQKEEPKTAEVHPSPPAVVETSVLEKQGSGSMVRTGSGFGTFSSSVIEELQGLKDSVQSLHGKLDQVLNRCAKMEPMLEKQATLSQTIIDDMDAAYLQIDKAQRKILAKVNDILSEFGGP